MDSKLIMVIAGSKWQIPIVKKIRELGHRTLVVNLYQDSPAFKYSDYSEVCDILDKNKCLEIAKKYNIDAVLSEECDIAMPTVAFVADSLNLPSLGMDNALLYTNKYRMREFCISHNLATPKFCKCKSLHEAFSFYDTVDNKLIIKPLDANSSRGVYIINSKHDLELHFQDALNFSKAENAVLIEEYIEGPEFTIDGIVTPTGHKSLAISLKKHYPHNNNIASELFFCNESTRFDYDELRYQNDKFVNLSNLRWGTLTHAEYKYANGQFYLIEIAARGGGNLISSHIVPLLSGLDNYSYYISSVLTNNSYNVPMSNLPETKYAVLKFFDIKKGGIVKDITGIDILRTHNNIICYQFNTKIGDIVNKAFDDSQRVGFYIAKGTSEKQLRELMQCIENNVNIVTI